MRELDPAAALRAELDQLRAEAVAQSARLGAELERVRSEAAAAAERERAAAERAAAAEAVAEHVRTQADRALAGAARARPTVRESDPLEAIEAQLEMGQRIAERFAPREPARPSLSGPEILAAVKLLCTEISGMMQAHHAAATERALAIRLAEIDAAQAQARPAAPEAEAAE